MKLELKEVLAGKLNARRKAEGKAPVEPASMTEEQFLSDGSLTPRHSGARNKLEWESMRDEELAVLMREIESDRVERKSTLADRDKVCQAICAFANDLPNHRQPGVMFIKDVPFDIRPVAAASIAELDLDYFRREYLPIALPFEVLSQNQRTVEQQLSALRFAGDADGRLVPTTLGLLVLSPDCLDVMPGAYVQFLRVDGADLTAPIKNEKRIDGRVADIVRITDEVLSANIEVATDVLSGLAESRKPDYPIAALRQLVLNAIMHRNYESTAAPVRIYWFADRVEINSPGGPYGQVNQSNFGKPGVTDYRNPNIAEVLHNLGWAQKFGVGIQIAKAELARNGNPDLEHQLSAEYISAILRKGKK